MDIAIIIAAATLAVTFISTAFDIVWAIYIERKHNKKEK